MTARMIMEGEHIGSSSHAASKGAVPATVARVTNRPSGLGVGRSSMGKLYLVAFGPGLKAKNSREGRSLGATSCLLPGGAGGKHNRNMTGLGGKETTKPV